MLMLAEPEFDIRGTDFHCILAGLSEHFVGHIDADDVPGWADLLGGEKAVEARTTTKIEDNFAGLHRRNSLRITAAKTEIGSLGHRSQFGLGVAHFTGLF